MSEVDAPAGCGTDPVPPDATSVCAYGVPTTAGGRTPGVMASADTDRLMYVVSVWPPASVTVSENGDAARRRVGTPPMYDDTPFEPGTIAEARRQTGARRARLHANGGVPPRSVMSSGDTRTERPTDAG